MFVVVLRSRKSSVYLVTAILVLGGLLWLWSWLNKPYPPPRVGLEASETDLAAKLFEPGQVGKIHLGSGAELRSQLDKGELDYIIEMEPSPDLMTRLVGELIPVIVVPFFDLAKEIDGNKLDSILNQDPSSVLVANDLGLPGFPWSDRPVQYLSSDGVIQGLQAGHGEIGVILIQDRVPAVRILPLTDTPSLNRSLYLSQPMKSWSQQLKNRYTKHQDLTASLENLLEDSIKMVAVGDIMLDRDVKKEGLKRGWEHIFSGVAPFISQADLAFANLESPIGDKGHFINMFQAPPEAMGGIVSAGFDVVSLANNHTLDYHIAGMFETMRLLEENGIAWVGAGRNIDEARSPLIMEVKGVKVGFLSYTEMWFVNAREPISWKATPTEAGVAPAELELVVEDVQRLRDQVDIVIVTVHWGKEYVHDPTPEQKMLARAAVDAGADLILGHHPHVVQGIEFYKQGVIAYSLGNFVFDLNLPKTWDTMILEFTLSRGGLLDLNIVPAYIFGVRPQIIEGAHKAGVHSLIRRLSLELD